MSPLNRRHFFHAAGMAIAAFQATRVMGANDRIQVGVVGPEANELLTRHYRAPYTFTV